MATLKGAQKTNFDAVPKVVPIANSHQGKLHLLYDKYEASGAVAQGDIIQINAPLPKGAMVVSAKMKFTSASTTGEFDVGWAASEDLDSDGNPVEAADPNGLLDGVDTATGVGEENDAETSVALPGIGKVFSAAVQLQAVATTATDAADTFEWFILYALP